MVGKVSTGSQFEMTFPGRPLFSIDSTQIFFTQGEYLATFDIKTSTLTNYEGNFSGGNDYNGLLIDHLRKRFISFYNNELVVFDYYTHELIYRSVISISGTHPTGLFIDKKRDELIVIHQANDPANTGAVSIFSLEDYSPKYEFITNSSIGCSLQTVLDEERSNLFLFYYDPAEFEVFSLDSRQFIYQSNDIPDNYYSPLALIDYKNDRIILCDNFKSNKNILIDLNDYSLDYTDFDFKGFQISVDTITNRLWYGGGYKIFGFNLSTFELVDIIEGPENYDINYFEVFTCPKFNRLFAFNGNYILIFDLQNHNYLGRIQVGSSPNGIVIDYLSNNLYTKEIRNPELTVFNDFNKEGIPKPINKIEIFETSGEGRGDCEIIPDHHEIIISGNNNLISYNYNNGSYKTYPIWIPKAITIDKVNERIFTGQATHSPVAELENRLRVFDFSLNLIWDMYIPMINTDIEYDSERYLYYLSRKSLYYQSPCKIYKIDTEFKQIVDSIEIGFEIPVIEYSGRNNALYVINTKTDIYPGRLYKIDCSSMTCVDSTEIEGLRTGYLADSIDMFFMVRWADGNSSITKLVCYDINSDSILSEQYFPTNTNPSAIGFNPITNTLYIVDFTIGGVYKYRNDTLPGLPPPAAPASPLLDVGDNQIIIRWTKNDAIAAYNLYRKKENEEWACVTYQPIIDTFYKDLNLINNIEYSYALSLLGKYYIEGEKSPAVTGTPIDLPDFEITRVYSDNVCSNDGKAAVFKFKIEKEALFDSNINFWTNTLPPGILSYVTIEPSDEDFLRVKLQSDGTAQSGNYTARLNATGGGQTHWIDFPFQVVDDIIITLDYQPKDLKAGDWITIEGSTYPLTGEPLLIQILSSEYSVIGQDTLQSDENGVFRSEYIAMTSDTLYVFAGLMDYEVRSDTLSVYIGPGDVSVTCVAAVTDSTGIGWNVQVTGMVFPNPGSGTVRLQITSPFDSVQLVDNIPVNEFGYYGHTFNPDTTGLWKIVAYYSGNKNYGAATSHINFVPIGIKSGYAIIMVGDVSNVSSALDTTFRNLGSYAYRVMLDRHLGKDEIFLIFPDINSDPDGNGNIDDVDGVSDFNSLKAAFEWADTAITDSLDLTIYLVSRGDTENFWVNGSENLPVDSLDQWLDDFSLHQPNSKINIVVENSEGSQYINKLTGANRRILTSTNDSVPYFFNYGDISFSGYFWNYILQGASVGESFIVSRSVMNTFPDLFFGQECLVDANHNMISNEQEDYDLLSEVYIGYGTRIDNFAPEIFGSIIDTEIDHSGIKKKKSGFTLKEAQQNDLYLSVLIQSTAGNLETVYAILIQNGTKSGFKRKSFNQLPDYRIYPLSRYGKTNYYITPVDEFFNIGNYTFIVYASDPAGIKSYPGYCRFSIVDITENQNKIEDIFSDPGINLNVYPNPFSSHLKVEYELEEMGDVIVKIYNESGVLMDILDHGKKPAGIHSLGYVASKLKDGIYFVSVEVKNKELRSVKKIIRIE
jgi:hypothetical protein